VSPIDKLRYSLRVLDEISISALAGQTVAEARAALDELQAQLFARTEALEHFKGLLQDVSYAVHGANTGEPEKLADAIREKLAAQPKALEWREPSTAPWSVDDATPALLVRCTEGDTYLARCDPRGRWFDDYGEELEGVVGWLPLDALPPAPKGGSDD
jgi:hypothetical protein